MEIIKFKDLLERGFDVEFNIEDVFYSFTSNLVNNKKMYYIGNENHSINVSFDLVDELLKFQINNKEIIDIIFNLNEEEIYY
ncbi:MAG: hypothetical protein HUJ59_05745 [Bacilli bacterium]|nr:hypothetical protein [Bacilli bacterium]